MALKKQKTYKDVYDIACSTLLHSDMKRQLENAGLEYISEAGSLVASIPFFDERITLTLPGLVFKTDGGNITLVTKIILLHYINTASGVATGGSLVAYEDIPGCRHYQPVFEKRVSRPLATAFGQDKYAFLEAGITLGGTKEEYGDASVTLHALPRVPITFILWEGDEEFMPLLRVLFDPSITGYLPLEDIVVISKLASTRIVKTARKQYMGENF